MVHCVYSLPMHLKLQRSRPKPRLLEAKPKANKFCPREILALRLRHHRRRRHHHHHQQQQQQQQQRLVATTTAALRSCTVLSQ